MSKFILGPSVGNIVESGTPVAALDNSIRTSVVFDFPAIVPGGTVRLRVSADFGPEWIKPVNVYAFYVPTDLLPAEGLLTPEYLFSSGHKSGVTPVVGVIDAPFLVSVAGVEPSLTPYFVQTIVEYPS